MSKYSKSTEVIIKFSSEKYWVTQLGATELPGAGEYHADSQRGISVDIVAGDPIFATSDKHETGSGWPSFTDRPAICNRKTGR